MLFWNINNNITAYFKGDSSVKHVLTNDLHNGNPKVFRNVELCF